MHERFDKEEGYGKSQIRREVGLELEEIKRGGQGRKETRGELEVSFKVKD